MRRFRVAALASPGERVTLEPGPARHLVVVLRHRPGDAVLLFDGAGSEAEAVVVATSPDAVLEVTSAVRPARPPFDLHLLFAVTKGPAMDDAVRMATEAGATHLHPVLARRSVATGDRGDRWARIASEAARQSGRADVPVVAPVAPLAAALAALPEGLDRRVAVPGAPRLPHASGPAAVLVGPEGGLTDDEVRLALDHGFQPMGLGRFVLRAETAAAVSVALTAAI